MRPLFDHYGARITFFVDGYAGLDAGAKAQLADLAADGHDIEYHSVAHHNAETYAAANGVAAYVDADIRPGLDAMRADGWDPIVFAYPHGARTAETDAALLEIFSHLRAIHSTCPGR
jgi:peptidoglycan/xylan/chitin deacetylase (PgdA/CDA1 family)